MVHKPHLGAAFLILLVGSSHGTDSRKPTLMVLGGGQKEIEVFGAPEDCPKPRELADRYKEGTMGALREATLVACTTQINGAQCYAYSTATQSWSEDTTKTRRSVYAPHALLLSNGSWIITGGTSSYWLSGEDERQFFDDVDISKGPGMPFKNSGLKLPEPLAYHCVAEINDTHVLVSGGFDASRRMSKRAYIVDLASGQHVKVADMSKKRRAHTCTAIHGEGNSTRGVLVVGGDSNSQTTVTTETFSLDSNSWELGSYSAPDKAVVVRDADSGELVFVTTQRVYKMGHSSPWFPVGDLEIQDRVYWKGIAVVPLPADFLRALCSRCPGMAPRPENATLTSSDFNSVT